MDSVGWENNTRIEKIDRISVLSDDLVSHILSLLPTEDAVRTCILSKRWKCLWISITNFDFDRTSSRVEVPRPTHFVDQVLHLSNSKKILKFRLNEFHDPKRPDNDCSTWISEAVKRNVYELDLNLDSWWDLPVSFFTCKTLTVLKLYIGPIFAPIIPTSFCLPCLKNLEVRLEFPVTNFAQKLIRSCPVLEDLYLTGHLEDKREVIFNVYAPALRRFRIQLHLVYDEEVEQKFIIHAPNLVYLHVDAISLAKYMVKNFASLAEASVNLNDSIDEYEENQDYANRALRLLRGISDVKSLQLGHSILYVLHFANDGPLPTFHNLTRLEVAIQDYYGWEMLVDLLRCSPNLEVFTLQQQVRLLLDNSISFFEKLEDSYWSKQTPAPSCLLLHLKVIEMEGFHGNDYDLDLVEYLLGNAEVLETLTIKAPNLTLEEEVTFCKEVLKFPRASRICQIDFLGDLFSKF